VFVCRTRLREWLRIAKVSASKNCGGGRASRRGMVCETAINHIGGTPQHPLPVGTVDIGWQTLVYPLGITSTFYNYVHEYRGVLRGFQVAH
jgi:hypothetical protein